MRTKQTISIIGAAGSMGSAIAKSLSSGNYRLLLVAGISHNAKTLAKKILAINPTAEVEAIDCSYNACWEADIIIIATPFEAESDIARKVREVANQKIVVSIANPLNNTNDDLVTASGTSAAEELQKLLPNSKVVKAFNTTFASDFDQPIVEGQQPDALIAGDDAEALSIVSDIVRTAGFNPVIAGPLSMSRTLEKSMVDGGHLTK